MPKRARLIVEILTIVVLPIVGIVAYIAFSRWPTGAAVGMDANLVHHAPPATRPTVLRLAAFNIHSGIGTDDKFDLDRTAATLKDCDLIGLTEVRGGFRTNQADTLGEKLSLNSLFSPNERTLFHDDFGNALLSRVPITWWQRMPIPDTQLTHHRNLILLQTSFDGGPLMVLIAHVARDEDHANQLAYLNHLFFSLTPPVALMGDLNTEATDPLLAPFLQNSTDAVATHAQGDSHRIDWIFTRGLDVKNSGIVDLHASDHPMVWADVALPRQ